MFGLNINKYIVYIIIAGLSIAGIIGYLAIWRHNIRQQAMLEFNNKQLEQVVKDQQNVIKQLKDIENIQQNVVDSLNKNNEDLNNRLSNLETYLNSDEANKDSRPSSKVLKNTIKELSGEK